MPAKARQEFGSGDCDTIEENVPDVPRFRGRTRVDLDLAITPSRPYTTQCSTSMNARHLFREGTRCYA